MPWAERASQALALLPWLSLLLLSLALSCVHFQGQRWTGLAEVVQQGHSADEGSMPEQRQRQSERMSCVALPSSTWNLLLLDLRRFGF